MALLVLHKQVTRFACFGLNVQDQVHQDCRNQQLKHHLRQQDNKGMLGGVPSGVLGVMIDASSSLG